MAVGIFAGTKSLQQVVDTQTLSTGLVRLFAQDVASALEYLHSQKMVHLDLKPSNVLITPYQIAKLGQYNCAKLLVVCLFS